MKTVKQLVWEKREGGNAGGVPKFAWYLQKAVGGEVYAVRNGGNDNWDNGLPVVDGNLSKWIGDIPIVSVVHGTWKEFAIRNDWPSFCHGEVADQDVQWKRKNVICAAVSHASARQLKQHHGVEAKAVIYNCVDTGLYVPKQPSNKKPVIVYAANDKNKGSDRAHQINLLIGDKFEMRYLGARPGQEQDKFVQADIYIHPSRYEGNSFACLEAMSCDIPGVYTKCGLMEDMDAKDVGGIVPWDASPKVLADEIVRVYEERDKYHPREWVLKNATFEIFKDKWTNFLKEYL